MWYALGLSTKDIPAPGQLYHPYATGDGEASERVGNMKSGAFAQCHEQYTGLRILVSVFSPQLLQIQEKRGPKAAMS